MILLLIQLCIDLFIDYRFGDYLFFFYLSSYVYIHLFIYYHLQSKLFSLYYYKLHNLF